MIEISVAIRYFPPPPSPSPNEMTFALCRQILKLSSVREEQVHVFDKIITSLLMENEISYNYQIF